MLEDFLPKDDKTPRVRGGDVIQPATNQTPSQEANRQPTTTAPAGPYRPSILGQQTPKEAITTNPAPKENNTNDKPAPSSQTQSTPSQQMAKKPKSLKKKLLISFICLILIGGLGFLGWWFGLRDTNVSSTSKNATNSSAETKKEPSNSKLVVAPLSGLEVEPSLAARPVTAIMIENSEEARPQSGLIDADLVFEAIAEGGITRFLALFQSKKPDYIGPVRSARPYYVEWAKTFDASYVHAGGSPDGLRAITDLGVKDISAFAYGDDVFYRTTDRQSPHNLYSSFKGLDKVNQEKGFTSSKFDAWSRKKDVPQTPTAINIDITLSSAYYNPSYKFDALTNSYLRSEGGEIHKDEKSNKQLSPKTVLVMAMTRSQEGIYSIYKTSGSGKFLAFQDGIASEGTWSRSSVTNQYKFKDSNGFDFLFNKGQVWVSIVTDINNVKYTP